MYLAAAALVTGSLAPALPDTAAGSPRAIAVALTTGLLAAAALLRGMDSAPRK